MTAVTRGIGLLVLAAAPAIAQSNTGGDPVDFPGGDRDAGIFASTLLMMGISPRAVALGEAMGAVEGDPTSIWYNAAGITRINTNSFMVTGSQRFGDTQLAGAAVTFPTPLGTFGIATRAFNAGTIQRTEDYNPVGRARAYQFALEGGGSIQLSENWYWGGTLFYAQETLAEDSHGTIGVNSAMMFPGIFFSRLTLGAGVRNWGTAVEFEEMSFRPPLYGFGAAAFDLFRNRDLISTPLLFRGQPIVLDAKIVGQVNIPDRQEIYGMGGIEATVNGVAIGRVGYQGGDDNNSGFSLGAGVNVGQFRLEYAFRDRRNTGASFFSDDIIGDEHHVAATYFWGGRASNAPAVPVIVTQPVDTAAINEAVRRAVQNELAQIRPLLDSLRNAQVEVRQTSDIDAQYIVPVYFGFDSSMVREDDMDVLGQVAEVIRRVYPSALVTIQGFADPAGTPQYNEALSKRRAEAVMRVMIERFGMPAGQFRTVGYGEDRPSQVVPGAQRDAPGAMLNRRVTFTIDATQRF